MQTFPDAFFPTAFHATNLFSFFHNTMLPPIALLQSSLFQAYTKGLTLKTSVLVSLYGGEITFPSQLIKLNIPINKVCYGVIDVQCIMFQYTIFRILLLIAERLIIVMIMAEKIALILTEIC